MYKHFFKRLIDFCIVFTALLVIWPILLVIYIWLTIANKGAGTLKNRMTRYIKSNIGTKGAFDKMTKLIDKCEFISLKQANLSIDWTKTKIIDL